MARASSLGATTLMPTPIATHSIAPSRQRASTSTPASLRPAEIDVVRPFEMDAIVANCSSAARQREPDAQRQHVGGRGIARALDQREPHARARLRDPRDGPCRPRPARLLVRENESSRRCARGGERVGHVLRRRDLSSNRRAAARAATPARRPKRRRTGRFRPRRRHCLSVFGQRENAIPRTISPRMMRYAAKTP